MENLSLTTPTGTYVLDATAQTLVFTPVDGSAAVTLGLPTTTEPTITEVDVKESDGTEVVADPV